MCNNSSILSTESNAKQLKKTVTFVDETEELPSSNVPGKCLLRRQEGSGHLTAALLRADTEVSSIIKEMIEDEDSAEEEQKENLRQTLKRYPTLGNLDQVRAYKSLGRPLDPERQNKLNEVRIWLSYNGFDDQNDVRCFGSVVETPLHVAVRHNEYRMVKRLLQSDADSEFQDHKGRTALDLALCISNRGEDREEIISLLKKGGASSSCDSLDTIHKNIAVQDFLDEHGFSSVNDKKVKKRVLCRDSIIYPLHLAVKMQEAAMVEALIWAGADPLCVNHKGQSPLSIAKTKPDGNIIRLLAVC